MMLKKLLFLISATLLVSACNDNKNEDNRPIPPAGYIYAEQNNAIGSGTLRSEMLFFGESGVKSAASAAPFIDPAARFEFRLEEGKIYLYMHATRFAAGMPPMQMRMTSPATFDGNTMKITADALIPEYYEPGNKIWVAGDSYPITKLSASVIETLCGVAFTCTTRFGTFEVSYLGHLIVKAN